MFQQPEPGRIPIVHINHCGEGYLPTGRYLALECVISEETFAFCSNVHDGNHKLYPLFGISVLDTLPNIRLNIGTRIRQNGFAYVEDQRGNQRKIRAILVTEFVSWMDDVTFLMERILRQNAFAHGYRVNRDQPNGYSIAIDNRGSEIHAFLSPVWLSRIFGERVALFDKDHIAQVLCDTENIISANPEDQVRQHPILVSDDHFERLKKKLLPSFGDQWGLPNNIQRICSVLDSD